MKSKRRDHKNRVLRTGESQRKDLLYQYRYTDADGVRRTIYSSDLNELRNKEQKIQDWIKKGLLFYDGEITVLDFFTKFINSKKNLKNNTILTYYATTKHLESTRLSRMKIRDVRVMDAKQWCIDMHENGLSFQTIATHKNRLHAAFTAAIEDDILIKNPFSFSLSAILPKNDTDKKKSLSAEEQRALLNFVRTDKCSQKYYDYLIILLGTGLRISEFCGLCINDLDFERKTITIARQLQYNYHQAQFCVSPPKTKSGTRVIPMLPLVEQSLKNILAARKVKKEYVVDGCSGFLFYNRNMDRPYNRYSLNAALNRIAQRYNRCHPELPIASIHPHTFRHTFCSNLVQANVGIKNIQYIMGHSTIDMTLNVYSHTDPNIVCNQVLQHPNFMLED